MKNRLLAIERVIAGRWGEFEFNEDQEENSAPPDVTVLADLVNGVMKDMSKLTDAMDKLIRETAETGNAIDAFILQQNEMLNLLRENAANPDAVNQIADTLQAYQDRLATAVVVNTPAATTTSVEEVFAAPTAEETAAATNSVGVEVPALTP